jgi:hypothetical protein
MFLLYMAEENPFTNGDIKLDRKADGIAYYILPDRFPLFRATKSSRYLTPDNTSLTLKPREFFGVYNMDPAYIASYEKEYGIIFAFETTHQYELLALDDKQTQEILYNDAPPNIKQILKNNYGYMLGTRESVLDSDLVLSQYLCTKGYQGYATNTMPTSFEGTFQPEFMICDVGGITLRRRVTNDQIRINAILEAAALNKFARQLKVGRKVRPVKSSSPIASPYGSRSPPARLYRGDKSASPDRSSSSAFASYNSPGSISMSSMLSNAFAPDSPDRSSSSAFASYDSPGPQARSGIPFRLGYMDDDDNHKEISPPYTNRSPPSTNKKAPPRTNKKLFGGLRKGKRRSYKKRKTRTNKKKRSTHRRR